MQEFNKNVVACNMSASGREHFECVGLGLANYLKQVIRWAILPRDEDPILTKNRNKGSCTLN